MLEEPALPDSGAKPGGRQKPTEPASCSDPRTANDRQTASGRFRLYTIRNRLRTSRGVLVRFRSGVALTTTVILTVLTSTGTLAASASPEVGTSAEDVDLSTVPGATPYGEGSAIPLRADVPDWYTPELAAEVDAANGEPVAAPDDAPLPSEVGIRPGAWMISPYGCTMNFIFERSGTYAIGTAGHCVDKVGQEVVLLTLAPGGENPVLVEVGEVLKRHNNGIGDDFALVSIRPELQSQVSPTTALIGGPCGQYAGSGPETVAHIGHGLVIGTGGTPRAGAALTWFDDSYGWDGAAIFGDSGSPVRVTDLKAAGNLTHLVVDRDFVPSFIAGTRIQKMLKIARGYSLADSPLCLGS